jgi:c-di-GMP-binding flagellar brake protein YcgR
MSMDDLGKERRGYIRVDTVLAVRFKIDGEIRGKVFKGLTQNISHGGMCLRVEDDLDTVESELAGGGRLLHLTIDFPSAPVEVGASAQWASARVDWLRKPSIRQRYILAGLEFESVGDPVRDLLHQSIVAQFVKEYRPATE